MKVSEQWLREWVNPKQDINAIAQLLSLSGLEVDAVHSDESDHILEIAITPNRGDCLSIQGIARELSALTQTPLTPPDISVIAPTLNEQITITLQSPDCPIYRGRIIKGVDNQKPTPDFIAKRLQQLGIRNISFVVDVTNYVMSELGQPLHAFDLDKIKDKIIVRDALVGESLVLLDETHAQLDARNLVIADSEKPLALGGVMGGLDSGVIFETQNILLEAAFFQAQRIAGQTRQFGINSEAAYHYERGVDPNLSALAIERATALILQYAGGEAGPIVTSGEIPAAPNAITLRLSRINRILGMNFPAEKVPELLQRLQMQVSGTSDTWQVTPPQFRFDIRKEIDLIEELARVYGYEHISAQSPQLSLQTIPVPENQLLPDRLRALCVDRGYAELMTYSFVESHLQAQFSANHAVLPLLNPMSSQMDVMRLSLLPGLLQALCYNQNRQQTHMRLFELGLCFVPQGDTLQQTQKMAGLIFSQQPDKHWQIASREMNFYDVKGDVEALLALTGKANSFTWRQCEHPGLHPGQTAKIMQGNEEVGFVGQLHPEMAKTLDIKGKVFVFELQLAQLCEARVPHYQTLSKFPSIRRDLAMVVSRDVAAQDLCNIVAEQAGALLQSIHIFDVYQGENIGVGRKSIAMGIILQSPEKTLVDAEINALMHKVREALEQNVQALIRE